MCVVWCGEDLNPFEEEEIHIKTKNFPDVPGGY